MAGDALMDEENQSAKEAGFRNENERRLGTEEYDRLSGSGLQDATDAGKYSAKEVISEMRSGRDGKSTEEMASYYQGLADEGTKFNKRAQDFLSERHGVTFGKSGGGDDKPADPVTEDPITADPVTPPDNDGVPTNPPITGGPGVPSPFSQTQIVNQDNDINNTVTGDNNTTNINQDNSVTQSGGSAYLADWMKSHNFFK